VPDDISDDQCDLFEPAAVAIHAIDRSGIGVGSSVLIVGAGPIGALCMLAAHAAGATQIFMSDNNENRLALMKRILPACMTINPKQGELLTIVRDSTIGNAGVDVAFECVGNGFALNDCIAAVRRRGVVVQVGVHMQPASVDCISVTFKEIDLRGSIAYPTDIWPRVSSIMTSGNFPAEKIVTRRIDLTQVVEQGFEALLDPAGKDIKILIDVTA
jgi:(R,R)-butanediol dehydrogenase/meso-butanediol dehydrogenase/diacetyl reductase